jgi:hypothetical protein
MDIAIIDLTGRFETLFNVHQVNVIKTDGNKIKFTDHDFLNAQDISNYIFSGSNNGKKYIRNININEIQKINIKD